MKTYNLHFKWTTSKGRDTYGYNIVTLRVDGDFAARCNGGGYDMQGTVLADWMKKTFSDLLKTIQGNSGSGDENGFYGLGFYCEKPKGTFTRHKSYQEGDTISLDGACGMSSMERILNHFGMALRRVGETKNDTFYTLGPKEEN